MYKKEDDVIYHLSLTFTVTGLKSKQDAEDCAINLAEHVLDTFNDNGSIDPIVQYHVEPKQQPKGGEDQHVQ